ncbi:MAG: glycerophosphodiester phosphodiesterase [Arachnia sp.]
MTSVWAHRGASAAAPENTIPAFELAVEHGADGVEFDVQLTADGHPVVFHDEKLQRITGAPGRVRETTLEQLRQLDASTGREGFAGTRVPTLDEALELLAPTGVWINIELKTNRVADGLEESVISLIDDYEVRGRSSVSSFHHKSLRYLARIDPGLRLGTLYSDPILRPWRYAVELGTQALHARMDSVTGKLIDKCHAHLLQVAVWTVDDKDDIKRMAQLGADAIITNHPQRAARLLR